MIRVAPVVAITLLLALSGRVVAGEMQPPRITRADVDWDSAAQKLGDLADDLAEGRIAPEPYRAGAEMPCENCAFAAICPYDPVTGRAREVAKLKKEETLARMKKSISP